MACLLLATATAHAQTKDAAPDPQEAVFAQNCAVCHNNPATRAPGRASLKAMSPAFVVEALTNGIMKAQGSALSPAQRASLAEYLTGQKIGVQAAMAGRCTGAPSSFTLAGPSYNGWGGNPENWRYQPEPGVSAADLPKLEVKWSFGFPGAVVAFGQPTVVGNRVFVGSQNGHVYSIDAQSGCYYWDFAASTGVRTAITVARIGDRNVAFFGDRRAHVYALDAGTGETVWKVTAVDAPSVQVTGAPALFFPCGRASGSVYVVQISLPVAASSATTAPLPLQHSYFGSIAALSSPTEIGT